MKNTLVTGAAIAFSMIASNAFANEASQNDPFESGYSLEFRDGLTVVHLLDNYEADLSDICPLAKKMLETDEIQENIRSKIDNNKIAVSSYEAHYKCP